GERPGVVRRTGWIRGQRPAHCRTHASRSSREHRRTLPQRHDRTAPRFVSSQHVHGEPGVSDQDAVHHRSRAVSVLRVHSGRTRTASGLLARTDGRDRIPALVWRRPVRLRLHPVRIAMAQWLFHLCEQIEATSLGVFVRESIWGFPILVAIHIIGLVFSAGIVVWLDLRLLGISMTGVPVSRVYRRLMPLAFLGFTVMLVSGGTILTGFATS